jgi:hypothetical protein
MFDLAAALLWGALLVALILLLARLATRGVAWAEVNYPGAAGKAPGRWLRLLLLFAALCWLVGLILSWPPRWLQRIERRRIVETRVVEAGGWKTLSHDCQQLVDTHAEGETFWWWSRKAAELPPLPPSLAALEPRHVEVNWEPDGTCSVRITCFESRRGYVLKVFCIAPTNTLPLPSPRAPQDMVYGRRRLAEGVYEQ